MERPQRRSTVAFLPYTLRPGIQGITQNPCRRPPAGGIPLKKRSFCTPPLADFFTGRLYWCLFFLLLGMIVKAPQAYGQAHPPGSHPPRNLQGYIQQLESPARAAWQKPDEVLSALRLLRGETVADIGAGSGYFSVLFAREVGKEGKVLAVDIEPGMLAFLEKRAREGKLDNLRTLRAQPDDPQLPPSSVDTLFICNTTHHIENRPAYYKKLRESLRPEGRLVIVDFQKGEAPVGPPPAMKIAREEMVKEVEGAGYQLFGEYYFLPYQYFLVFKPLPAS